MRPLFLILCTGNSCRSQMAEAVLRASVGELAEVASAGSRPAGYVHPLAVRVMREAGFDLSGARSKSLEEFLNREVDTVITVCGAADAACPAFPGPCHRVHWAFDDPARATGREEEQLAEFRRVRDEIIRVFSAFGYGLRRGLVLNAGGRRS